MRLSYDSSISIKAVAYDLCLQVCLMSQRWGPVRQTAYWYMIIRSFWSQKAGQLSSGKVTVQRRLDIMDYITYHSLLIEAAQNQRLHGVHHSTSCNFPLNNELYACEECVTC